MTQRPGLFFPKKKKIKKAGGEKRERRNLNPPKQDINFPSGGGPPSRETFTMKSKSQMKRNRKGKDKSQAKGFHSLKGDNPIKNTKKKENEV